MDPGIITLITVVIGAVARIIQLLLQARGEKGTSALKIGRAYRLPPQCQVREMEGGRVIIEADDRTSSLDGSPDGHR